MKVENRVSLNRTIAEGYRNACMKKGVEEGERYDAWNFGPFIEPVISIRGPFREQTQYRDAIARALDTASISY